MKKTPLYSRHVAQGARMTDFHGWQMPLWYQGIHEEHRAVRSAAGLFDVSHMGRLIIRGPQAPAAVDFLTTNHASRLAVNQGQYSLLCDDSGGILDDLVVYRLGEEEFLLCVNAGNREDDFRWIQEHLPGKAEVVDISSEEVQLALQGPCAEEILQELTAENLAELPYYTCSRCQVAGVDTLLSRTGYTGERGFELYFSERQAEALWEKLLEAGKSLRIQPAGLGARDTLRLEMGYVLHGNDISPKTTPLEAKLGWLIKWDKGEFIGKERLQKQKAVGVQRKLIGFEMRGRGIPRPGYRISSGDRFVGEVTSGSFSPSLGKAIGLGYVSADLAVSGTPLEIEIRNRYIQAEVVSTPFYPSQIKPKTPTKK